MSWAFNADYESFIFSGKGDYKISSNKINQEFEYFIHFLESEPLFSTKRYDPEYIKNIQSLSGKEFLVEGDPSRAKPWWCAIGEKENDRLLHSKITSTRFAMLTGYEKQASLVSALNFSPKENFLYKMEGELSGRGHLQWPLNESKIKRLLEEGHTLIEEPLRKRTRDFSALVLNDKKWIFYRNLVDEKFQYKGTLLIEPEMTLAQRAEYELAIRALTKHYLSLGADYPFSIDSYFYLEGDEEKICAVSEVNVRKTMGYVAWRLKEFFQAKYAGLLLLGQEARTQSSEQAFFLSPTQNRFQSVFITAGGAEELMSLSDSFTRNR